MGNDRGTEPGTLGSPDYSPNENKQPSERQSDAPVRFRFSAAAAIEVTRRGFPSSGVDDPEDGEAAEIEIEAVFRRKLAGLRHLPRKERPHALRAARAWRQSALKELRDRRASERHARHMLRRLQAPTPC